MNDKPRKTLSLKRKAEPEKSDSASSAPTRKRKRIISRENLAERRPPPPPPKKTNAKKAKRLPRKPRAKPKPLVSPSDVRARELNDSLNAYRVWREQWPLARGVERAIFQHIGKHQLSASKRVVQKLLNQHCTRTTYLMNVGKGGQRYHLDGTPAGEIAQLERDHASQIIAGKSRVS